MPFLVAKSKRKFQVNCLAGCGLHGIIAVPVKMSRKNNAMKNILLVASAAWLAAASAAPCDPLTKFWRENDGKTVRRLPVDVLPENAFWGFGTRDFLNGMKAFNRMADEGFAKSTYNCVTLTLRCNPELGDAETMSAAKAFFAKARAAGVKVYMDTDPRIARQEFFTRWPNERQGIAAVVTVVPTNGVAAFTYTFKDATDHMTGGARNSYRPLSARVAAAFAARRRADGTLDLAKRRPVDVASAVSVRERRDEGGGGYMDRADASVTGKATDLAADETLVATLEADYFSIDVFSPHFLPFARELMARYKELGADGGMRDEWGFIPDHNPSLRTFWWSPHFEAAYRAACGRSLMDDFPLMACGPRGDTARAAAIGTFMRLILTRNVEIEQDFYATDKRLFGEDTYVVKHPTWHSNICPQEYFHHGLDWWQARRDWAQGDENAPIYALNAIAKKWGGPVWLNEGYTATPEHNVFRVWTYALCGGRQVYHGLYSGNPQAMKKYHEMPWEESRVRKSVDLLAPGNVTAQSRVRLPNLITRAQVDSPIAYVFGHERLVDWSSDGWNDHGQWKILGLMSQGWWCDAYPASECALGTFTVDEDGCLRVGQQRYMAAMLHSLSESERRAFDALVKRYDLKTRIFRGDEDKAVGAYLEQVGAVRQPRVKGKTRAGYVYPEPDGTLRLIDGTAIRVRADWEHPRGLPIAETIESNGAKVSVVAEGLCAVRAEKGQVAALAAGGLTRVEGPGLALALERPEDVVLLKIDGEWHGIWQTPEANKPIPDQLAALTPHWIRLLLPSHLAASMPR